MKKLFEVFLLLLLLVPPALADDPLRVVVFSDSLMANAQMQPEQYFAAKLDRQLKKSGFLSTQVTDLSVSGVTSNDAVGRTDAIFSLQPDVVVLALGTNDVQSGVEVNILQRNLGVILERLASAHIYTILVGVRAPEGANNLYKSQLATAFYVLATNYKVPFYPDALQGIFGNSQMSMADGFHPNSRGIDLMLTYLYPMVDAGLRWRLQVLEYNRQYQQSQ